MKSPKITKKLIQQEIDLMEMFGIDATDDDELKNSLGQAIIDHIVSRTEDGKGVKFGSGGNGTEVKLKSPYSKKYQESREFIAAGKKADEINMELTGDMMASIDMSAPGNKIRIEITDDLQVLKAYNHITGDTVPARPFFGVTKDELSAIGSQYQAQIDKHRSAADKNTPSTMRLIDLLNQINSSDGAGVVDVGEVDE